MIFKLNTTITTIPEQSYLVLEDMVRVVMTNGHYFVGSYDVIEWLRDKVINNEKYFSPAYRDLIKKNGTLFSPTGNQKRYLQEICVGYKEDGVFSPKDIVKIASCSNYMILENGLYDWRTFCKWVELYIQHDTDVPSLARDVNAAIKQAKLMPLNGGGGNGTIINVFETYKPTYGKYLKYKFAAIFDSDKTTQSDNKNHNAVLLSYLQNEQIQGYELKKREIENYFNQEAYRKAGLINNEQFLRSLTEQEWDYNDFSDNKGRFGVKMEKKDVLALCKFLTYDGLKSRLWDGNDEVVKVMNLLAKYI